MMIWAKNITTFSGKVFSSELPKQRLRAAWDVRLRAGTCKSTMYVDDKKIWVVPCTSLVYEVIPTTKIHT